MVNRENGPGSGSAGRWALAAALLAFVLLAATLALPAEEDAFIYYRYAWNWAHGKGLVFNTGDPVEGFSGPLWMMVLGLLARGGFDLPSTAPLVGIACGVATLLATDFLGRAVGLSRFGRLAAVFGVALSHPFAVWARSGLETPFYSLAITLAAGAYVQAEYPVDGEGRYRRLAALVPVLVSLGRPEGVVLAGLMVADRLTDRQDPRNVAGALRYGLPTAAGYGGYLAWRFLTFHSLVPNTSVKLYPLLIGRSTSQFLGYALYLGALPLLLPFLGLARTRKRSADRRRLVFLLAAAGFLSVFFNFLSGGDYRPGFRYFIPTLPLVLVAVWYGFERLPHRPLARAALAALLFCGPLVLLWREPPKIAGWRESVLRQWRDPFSNPADHWGAGIAFWIERNVPPGSVVAFGQMGHVPYYLARRGHEVTFIDTLGLVDRPVARIYRFDRKLKTLAADLRAGHSLGEALALGRRRRARELAATVLGRHPDFILLETALQDYEMMRALLASPELAARYREIGQLPPTGAPDLRIFARRAESGT